VADTIGHLLDAAGARDATAVLVTIGADRPPGAEGFGDVASQARSVREMAPRSAGDLAIVGYTSGTTGPPKGAMISPYGRCAFIGTLSFVSGIWGVILPHLYTAGTVTFLPRNVSKKVRKDQLREQLAREGSPPCLR
jgi:AMP-binding enzyme